MIIYGVALLAICTLAGVIMGDMLTTLQSSLRSLQCAAGAF